MQAAKAAEAALAGKQAVVEQLQQEVKEAEAVVNENSQSSHSQEATISAAVVAAQQATALVSCYIRTLDNPEPKCDASMYDAFKTYDLP